jgi:hypothetical protein
MDELDRDILRLSPDAGQQADFTSAAAFYRRLQETVPTPPLASSCLP